MKKLASFFYTLLHDTEKTISEEHRGITPECKKKRKHITFIHFFLFKRSCKKEDKIYEQKMAMYNDNSFGDQRI